MKSTYRIMTSFLTSGAKNEKGRWGNYIIALGDQGERRALHIQVGYKPIEFSVAQDKCKLKSIRIVEVNYREGDI